MFEAGNFRGMRESSSVLELGAAGADWTCGRASALLGFSLFLLFTDWRTVSPSADVSLQATSFGCLMLLARRLRFGYQ
jgi:hypothetical protein